MKKLLSLVLAFSMITLFTACSEGETNNDNSDTTSSITAEDLTFAQYLLNDFKGIVSENPDMTTEDIAAELSSNEKILFDSIHMPVEEGFLSGFTNEITGFKSASMFGPSIGSIAFIGYVFETEGEDAAKKLSETLESSADPRWLICVEAEETVCEAVGNKVFFVMAPLSNQ